MAQLIRSVTSAAYDRYVRELSHAFLRRDWIYDPAYALAKDHEIYQKILRDPVFEHVISYRKRLVAGRDWTLEPASKQPGDRALARVLEALVREMRGFTGARFDLADSIFRGSAYAYIEGARKPVVVDGVPTLTWWTPTRLVDVDRRRFRLARPAPDEDARWQLWSVERERWEDLGERAAWFVRTVYQSTEDHLGYGRGLLDSLFFYLTAKTNLLTKGIAAAERFGEGFVTVGIENFRAQESEPVGAAEGAATIGDQWVEAIKKHRADNVLVHDKEDLIQLVTGVGEGFAVVLQLLEYVDRAVTVQILGSNLPTSASEGGSFAMAEVQEGSTESLVQHDRQKLAEDLDRDLIGAVYRYNRPQIVALGLGNARLPRFRLVHEPLSEPESAAATLTQLLAAGIKIRKDEAYRRIGYTQPQEGDELLDAVPAPSGGDQPPEAPKPSHDAGGLWSDLVKSRFGWDAPLGPNGKNGHA